jgi:hypothetical protein
MRQGRLIPGMSICTEQRNAEHRQPTPLDGGIQRISIGVTAFRIKHHSMVNVRDALATSSSRIDIWYPI